MKMIYYAIKMLDGRILYDTKSDKEYDAWQQIIGCSDMTESSLLIEFYLNEGFSVVELEDIN